MDDPNKRCELDNLSDHAMLSDVAQSWKTVSSKRTCGPRRPGVPSLGPRARLPMVRCRDLVYAR